VRQSARISSARTPCAGRDDDSGFALVEIIVSAVVLVAIAGGALTAIQSADRAGAEERHRAQAHGIAQEDQARLRSFRISDLSNLLETRTVTESGTPYTVESRGEFVTDATGTASCEEETTSPDYIRISSTVSWPSMGANPPVILQSIVAPPNGAIAADRGALAVAVHGGQGQGVPGVGLTGTGPATFSGSTGANGCAIFGNLPAGNYTLTPQPTGLVDADGDPPEPQVVSVVALSTNTVVLQLDEPGSANVGFTTRVGGNLVPSTADSVVVFNTGMTAAKAFGSLGSPVATVTATPLFPFASPDTVYAGACEANNPNPTDDAGAPAAAALASVNIAPGAAASATVELPALHLQVHGGTDAGSPGSPVQGATVKISDQNCDDSGGTPIERSFTTGSDGKLADPGLPTSVYDVCVDDGSAHTTATGVDLQTFTDVADFENGAQLDLYLGAGAAGPCP
jgi:Tfp pilus assembly protein PilV